MDKTESKKQRQFYLIVAVLLAALGTWKGLHGHSPKAPYYFLASGFFVVLEFGVPKLAFRIFSAWMKFAHVLGTVNTYIIVTILYFFFLTPIAILKRMFVRHSPFSQKAYRTNHSSWIPIETHGKLAERYEHPY